LLRHCEECVEERTCGLHAPALGGNDPLTDERVKHVLPIEPHGDSRFLAAPAEAVVPVGRGSRRRARSLERARSRNPGARQSAKQSRPHDRPGAAPPVSADLHHTCNAVLIDPVYAAPRAARAAGQNEAAPIATGAALAVSAGLTLRYCSRIA